MKRTIYMLTRGDEDSGLQVICAYDTEKAAKQALLALAKVDGEGSLEIRWHTPTSYQVIDPKDPDRHILDNAGIHECTLDQSEKPELKVKNRYLVARSNELTALTIVKACGTGAEAVEVLKELAKKDSAKYENPYVYWLAPTSYRIFANSKSTTKVLASAFILPETIPVYENTTSRTVYLLVTDSTPGPDVISVFETKEAAITALKERAARDVKCERTVKLIWRTPTRYDIIEKPGSHDFITVEIIERPLQKEREHESSLHTC